MVRLPLPWRTLVSLSASFGLLSGCAAPLTPPVVTSGPSASPAPDASAAQSAPASPGPVAAATVQEFSGKASFRNEALAGYSLSAIDARTGQAVPVVSDLASASGLAIRFASPTTDAQGRFGFSVAGLSEGQAIRVIASKGVASLETIVLSDRSAIGRQAYAVQQAGSELPIDEVTTSLAKIARGVMRQLANTRPTDAYPIMLTVMKVLYSMTDEMLATFVKNPTAANMVVRADLTPYELQLQMVQLVEMSLLSSVVRDLVTGTLKLVAQRTQEEYAAQHPPEVPLLGTLLETKLGPNGNLVVINSVTGKMADAATGDLESVAAAPVSTSSSQSRPPQPVNLSSAAIKVAISGDDGEPNDLDGYRVAFTLKPATVSRIDKLEVRLRNGHALLASAVRQNLDVPDEGLALSVPFDIDGQGGTSDDWDVTPWNSQYSADNIPNLATVLVHVGSQVYEYAIKTFDGDASQLIITAPGAVDAVVRPNDFTSFAGASSGYRVEVNLVDHTKVRYVRVRLLNGQGLIATNETTAAPGQNAISTAFIASGKDVPEAGWKHGAYKAGAVPTLATVDVITTDNNVYSLTVPYVN